VLALGAGQEGVAPIAEIMQKMEKVSDADFEQAIKSSPTVVIYCWAAWCGSCRIMAPTIEVLVNEYSDRVKFYKLDADENPNVASQFHIRSLPVIFIFVNGVLVDEVVGAAPRQFVEARLKRNLKN
jgi:thioredoxin